MTNVKEPQNQSPMLMTDLCEKLTPEQVKLLGKDPPDWALKPNLDPRKRGMFVIVPQYVIELLNLVFGFSGWELCWETLYADWSTKGFFVVKGFILYNKGKPNEAKTNWQAGGNDNYDLGDRVKGALTDCLTKCGQFLHIAQNVFKGELDTPATTQQQQGNQFYKTVKQSPVQNLQKFPQQQQNVQFPQQPQNFVPQPPPQYPLQQPQVQQQNFGNQPQNPQQPIYNQQPQQPFYQNPPPAPPPQPDLIPQQPPVYQNNSFNQGGLPAQQLPPTSSNFSQSMPLQVTAYQAFNEENQDQQAINEAFLNPLAQQVQVPEVPPEIQQELEDEFKTLSRENQKENPLDMNIPPHPIPKPKLLATFFDGTPEDIMKYVFNYVVSNPKMAKSKSKKIKVELPISNNLTEVVNFLNTLPLDRLKRLGVELGYNSGNIAEEGGNYEPVATP